MQLDFLLVHYSLKEFKQNQLPNGFTFYTFKSDNQEPNKQPNLFLNNNEIRTSV